MQSFLSNGQEHSRYKRITDLFVEFTLLKIVPIIALVFLTVVPAAADETARNFGYRALSLGNPDPLIAARIHSKIGEKTAHLYAEMVLQNLKQNNRSTGYKGLLLNTVLDLTPPRWSVGINSGATALDVERANLDGSVVGLVQYKPLQNRDIEGFLLGGRGLLLTNVADKLVKDALVEIGLDPQDRRSYQTLSDILIGHQNAKSFDQADFAALDSEIKKAGEGIFQNLQNPNGILSAFISNSELDASIEIPEAVASGVKLRERLLDLEKQQRDNQETNDALNEEISELRKQIRDNNEVLREQFKKKVNDLIAERLQLEKFEHDIKKHYEESVSSPIFLGGQQIFSTAAKDLKIAYQAFNLFGSILNLFGEDEAAAFIFQFSSKALQTIDAIQTLNEIDWSSLSDAETSAALAAGVTIVGMISFIADMSQPDPTQEALQQLLQAVQQVLDNQAELLREQGYIQVTLSHQFYLTNVAIRALQNDQRDRLTSILKNLNNLSIAQQVFYSNLKNGQKEILLELQIGDLIRQLARLSPYRELPFGEAGSDTHITDTELRTLADRMLVDFQRSVDLFARAGELDRPGPDGVDGHKGETLWYETLQRLPLLERQNVVAAHFDSLCASQAECISLEGLPDRFRFTTLLEIYLQSLAVFAQTETGRDYLINHPEAEANYEKISSIVQQMHGASLFARDSLPALRSDYLSSLRELRTAVLRLSKLKLAAQVGVQTKCSLASSQETACKSIVPNFTPEKFSVSPQCKEVRIEDCFPDIAFLDQYLEDYVLHFPALPWFSQNTDCTTEESGEVTCLRTFREEAKGFPDTTLAFAKSNLTTEQLKSRYAQFSYANKAKLSRARGIILSKDDKTLFYPTRQFWKVGGKWATLYGDYTFANPIFGNRTKLDILLPEQVINVRRIFSGDRLDGLISFSSISSSEIWGRNDKSRFSYRKDWKNWTVGKKYDRAEVTRNQARHRDRKKFEERLKDGEDFAKRDTTKIRLESRFNLGLELLEEANLRSAIQARTEINSLWERSVDALSIKLDNVPDLTISSDFISTVNDVEVSTVTIEKSAIVLHTQIAGILSELSLSRMKLQTAFELGYGIDCLSLDGRTGAEYWLLATDYFPSGSEFFSLEDLSASDTMKRLDTGIKLLEQPLDRLPDTEMKTQCALGYAGATRMNDLVIYLKKWMDIGADPVAIRPENLAVSILGAK